MYVDTCRVRVLGRTGEKSRQSVVFLGNNTNGINLKVGEAREEK